MMAEFKTNDPEFKKKNNRKRIAIGTTAVITVVVVIVIVVVIQNSKDKNDCTLSAPNIQEEVYTLGKFVSVASSELVNNQINITVRYAGNESCYHHWGYAHVLSNAPIFEGGSKVKVGDHLYETSLILTDSSITSIALRICCCNQSYVTLELDIIALQQAGVQDKIPDLSNYTFTLTPIDKDTIRNISRVKLRMNSTVNMTFGTVDILFCFDWLNTTTTPFTVFEEVYLPTGSETSSVRIEDFFLDNGVPQGNIVVAPRVAQYGGILSASITKHMNDRYIKSIEQSKSIYIESSETNEVVPSGRFGIFRKPEDSETYIIYTDSRSFLCLTMGNPVPTVEIILKYPNGSLAEFQPIPTLRKHYSYHSIATVTKSQFANGGTFICKASSNGQTQTRELTFEFREEAQPCTLNSTLTGVITQTSDNDIVQCTAYGSPRPELEFRLYYYNGLDLTRYDPFQVSSAYLDDKTATANLTISPPNRDIHTVFCVCKQEVFSSSTGPDKYQSIVLYPGRPNNETLYWEIHEKKHRLGETVSTTV